jgi:hypothetical protein
MMNWLPSPRFAIARLFDRCHRAFLGLMQQPKSLLILRLTALLVLLHVDEFELAKLLPHLPQKILCGSMLLFPKLLTNKVMWLTLATVMVVHNIRYWFVLFNHEYLMTYWCLVCALAVWSEAPERVMGWNAKLTIGLCFFFSVVWKVLSNEYFDGSFLHLTFLLDRRLEMGAFLFGGLTPQILQGNREAFATLQAVDPSAEVTLATTALLSALSVVLSYWTLLIEGAIAISFCLPQPRWLYRNRDGLLILFLVTTYLLIPVIGFAALLALMGFAQCCANRSKVTYLVLFLLVPIWTTLPLGMFYLINFLS